MKYIIPLVSNDPKLYNTFEVHLDAREVTQRLADMAYAVEMLPSVIVPTVFVFGFAQHTQVRYIKGGAEYKKFNSELRIDKTGDVQVSIWLHDSDHEFTLEEWMDERNLNKHLDSITYTMQLEVNETRSYTCTKTFASREEAEQWKEDVNDDPSSPWLDDDCEVDAGRDMEREYADWFKITEERGEENE